MKKYYINKNTTTNPGKNNEVHTEGCYVMPTATNKKYLGEFSDGIAAVIYAKSIGYSNADGCKFCCPEAHHE